MESILSTKAALTMPYLQQSQRMAVRVIREIVDITDVYNDENHFSINQPCPSGNSTFELSVLTALNIASYCLNIIFFLIVIRVPMFRGIARHVFNSIVDKVTSLVLRPRVGENANNDSERGLQQPSIEIFEIAEGEQPLSHP